jgi:hypothetical protein
MKGVTPMSTEENKTIVLRLMGEYFNEKNETVWHELLISA